MTTVIHPNDVKKVGLIAISMCIFAHLRRKEMRKRWLKGEVDESKLRIVDHPVFGYLLENCTVFGLAYALAKYLPAVDRAKPMKSLLTLLIGSIVIVDPFIVFEKFCATVLFPHVPYFSPKAPNSDLKTIVSEYLKCNFPVMIISVLMQAALIFNYPEKAFEQAVRNPKPIQLAPFLAKLVYCRLFVDISFGFFHRMMHDIPWIYKNVHRTHHEHQTPRTQTNLHFTWIDLFMEGSFPVYLALASLTAMGVGPNRLEMWFLIAPMIYYESSSHTGKEIPIVTWIPPFSPLVDYFTGCDQRLIEYHTVHHQLYRCNYSISPWLDKLMGTYRIDLPEAYNSATAAEKQDS